MADVRTARLQLHPIDVAEGERIVARGAGPADRWADDFPFEGDVGAAEGFFAPPPRWGSSGRSATTGSPACPTGGQSGGSVSRVGPMAAA